MEDKDLGRGRQRACLVRAQCVRQHDLDLGWEGERERTGWVEAHLHSLLCHRRKLERGCVGRVGINFLEQSPC